MKDLDLSWEGGGHCCPAGESPQCGPLLCLWFFEGSHGLIYVWPQDEYWTQQRQVFGAIILGKKAQDCILLFLRCFPVGNLVVTWVSVRHGWGCRVHLTLDGQRLSVLFSTFSQPETPTYCERFLHDKYLTYVTSLVFKNFLWMR